MIVDVEAHVLVVAASADSATVAWGRVNLARAAAPPPTAAAGEEKVVAKPFEAETQHPRKRNDALITILIVAIV
jgi:hypothetical protein